MDHSPHALIVVSAAILLFGAGIVVLGLGWRRRYRRESSGMVMGQLSARQTVLSFVAVPAGGATGLLLIAVAAAALRH